ncbi:DUF6387 family protein [Aeromonas caviae]|uniref:DUF6387 family protein n=1 Tax=Aeromonas caviae TaxID=648 RepID=UPI0021E74415|nr:DUF6387 family protein [Aeromonas caviae]MCV3278989.1 DUF6387 family protein [Aeromonas caviae]
MYKRDYMKNTDFIQFRSSKTTVECFKQVCNHKKYKEIVDLTASSLFKQLRIRAGIFKALKDNNLASEEFIYAWGNMYKSTSIIIHQPDNVPYNIQGLMAEKLPSEFIDDIASQLGSEEITLSNAISLRDDALALIKALLPNKPRTLTFSDSVTPLSVFKVHEMANLACENELSPVDSFSAHHVIGSCTDITASAMKPSIGKNIAVAINLSDFTNKEILEDIGNLLDIWRNEANIELKKHTKKVSNITLQKIIKHKYILLLDAMILNQISGGAISSDIVLSCVYPNLEIHTDSLQKTYINNAASFFDPQKIRSWERTLVNLGLWDQPVRLALQKSF